MYILLFFGEYLSYQTKKERDKMIEQDTIKLLRECDAGVKMGTTSIGDVINSVEDKEF